MVGGNVHATLQTRSEGVVNAIGERVNTWVDAMDLFGWLDLISGTSDYTYLAKLEDSTHVFLCDYYPIDKSPEDKRILCDGVVYDVQYIDDPMNLHQHMEIYLKKVT